MDKRNDTYARRPVDKHGQLELDNYFDLFRSWVSAWLGSAQKKIVFNHNLLINVTMRSDSNLTLTKDSKWSGIKQRMKKLFALLIALIIIITGSVIYFKYFYTYSNGYRAGLLQKFSHKGNIIKTYEGEMILSSVTSNSNVALASEKFYFSVINTNLAQQLDTIQGRMVIVHYKQKNRVLFWHGDSEYLVDSVKRIHSD